MQLAYYKTKCEEYAELKMQEKKIQAKLAELQPEILKIAEEVIGDEKAVIGLSCGTLSLSKRKTWVYSDAYYEVEKNLDVLKKKEQLDGIAQAKELKCVIFKPIQ